MRLDAMLGIISLQGGREDSTAGRGVDRPGALASPPTRSVSSCGLFGMKALLLLLQSLALGVQHYSESTRSEKVLVDRILESNPDLVITEKSISVIRGSKCLAIKQIMHSTSSPKRTSLRSDAYASDNNRIARAVGTTIVNREEGIRESDVGTRCGLFNIDKIGDECFTFLTERTTPKAFTILLCGQSKDILNEVDRSLADAMSVACHVILNPMRMPGGGAVEMAISASRLGCSVWSRTLMQNAGENAIHAHTSLRAKDANGEHSWGIDRETGGVVDMKKYKTPAFCIAAHNAPNIQTFKNAMEVPRVLLRVDDVVQATRNERRQEQGALPEEPVQEFFQPIKSFHVH
ncbi:TCP-1/cpn60 chaperonin family-domain-containing protein [Russula dissimulans]|nr:TCP-1/cpn60 chaperonin family-domain-containing protein [Russula dissimulans]